MGTSSFTPRNRGAVLQCIASPGLADAVREGAAHQGITISGFVRRAIAFYAEVADLPADVAARMHLEAIAQKSVTFGLTDSIPRLKADLKAAAEA